MASTYMLALGGVMIAIVGVLAMLIGRQRHRTLRCIEQRFENLSGPGREGGDGGLLATLHLPRPVVRLFARAGVDLEPARACAWGLAGLAVMALIALMTTPLIGLAVATTAVLGLGLFLDRRAEARIDRMLEELPDVLDQMRQSLAAGMEPASAFLRAVESRDRDMGHLFHSALARIRLGGTLAEGMEAAHERLGVHDLQMLAALFGAHERFGGSLNVVMSNTVATLRDRERVRREFRAFSSETRTSAKVLAGLPLVIAAVLALVQPGHLTYFLSDSGRALGIVALCIYLLGLIILRRVTRLAY